MKILTVVRRLTRGGTERAAELFSRGYIDHGHSVLVYAWEEGGFREKALRNAGARVVVANGDCACDDAVFLKVLDEFKPDMVHIHRPGMPSDFESNLIRLARDYTTCIIETNVFGRVDSTHAGKLIDVHMPLTKWCLWRWHRWLSKSSDQIGVVVPNPVDCSAFDRPANSEIFAYRRKLGLPDDAFVMGRIGQKSDGKWHPAIIDVFARLAKDDPMVYLLAIGMPRECLRKLELLPEAIKSRVLDLGFIDNDKDLSLVLASMDLFLHAAEIGETFGYVLVEAMLCEVPVVTLARPHKDNSQVEVVGNGVGGIVSGGISGIYDACLSLRHDRDLRNKMGRQGRLSVLDRYSYQYVSSLALRVAQHVLSSGSKKDLRGRLLDDEMCVSLVDDQEIYNMVHGQMGAVDRLDLIKHYLIMNGFVYRLYQSLKKIIP